MTVECAKCDARAPGTPEQPPAGWVRRAAGSATAIFLVCERCNNQPEETRASSGDSTADQLRLFIERIERIEEEIRGIKGDRLDVLAEAKAMGFDTRTIRQIVNLRKMSPNDRAEAQAILDTYLSALGME